MRKKITYLIFMMIIFMGLIPKFSFAEELNKLTIQKVSKNLNIPIVKIEKVSRNLSLFNIHIGNITIPIQRSFSGYFRVNSDDRAVFRGLGRENDVMQFFFPTYYSRKKLREIMSVDQKALEYLQKFDQQLGMGQIIQMLSPWVSITGEILMPAGLAMAGVEEYTDTGTALLVGGGLLYLLGELGKIIGPRLEEGAFDYLDEAIAYFNTSRKEAFSTNSSKVLRLKIKNNKAVLTLSYNF